MKLHPDELSAAEGTDVKICCSSKELSPNEYIRWHHPKSGIERQVDLNYTCLQFPKIHRNDSGIYTCITENGTAVTNASIDVLCEFSVNYLNIQKSVFVNINRFTKEKLEIEKKVFPLVYTIYKKQLNNVFRHVI